MQKTYIKIIFLIFLFSLFNALDEIEYNIAHTYVVKARSSFSIKFNRLNGIKAEYEEMEENDDYEIISKGKKIYNLTSDELGLPNLKELFKLFNKINFPNETDWIDTTICDGPIWHLIVDGKDYYSNVDTEFMDKFVDITNLYDIMDYCKENY